MTPKDEITEQIDPEEFDKVIEACLATEKDGKGFFKLAEIYTSPAWKKAIGREFVKRGFYVRWISATYAYFRQN